MSTASMRAAVEGMPENDKAQLLAAIESHEKLQAFQEAVAGFDWKSLVTTLLPLITQFIPTLGPIISALLALLNVLPVNGGGTTPDGIPTPH